MALFRRFTNLPARGGAGSMLDTMDAPTKAAKKAPCDLCVAGPIGIEGHDDLRVQAVGNNTLRFECRSCGSAWNRNDAGPGKFVWVRIDPDEPVDRRKATGVPVPGR
jgi:hypothetical protein